MIAKYAPPVENDTGKYQQVVLAAVNNQNKKMSEYSASERQAIMQAMAKHEGFTEGQTEVLKQGSGTYTSSMGTEQSADSTNNKANMDATLAADQEIMAANGAQQTETETETEANTTESTDPEEDTVNEQIGEHIAKNAESYSANMLEQAINSSLLSEDQKNQLKKLHDIKQAETQGTDKVIPSNTVAKTPEETSNHAEAQNLYKRYATLSLDDVNNNTAISDKQKEVLTLVVKYQTSYQRRVY